MPEGKKYFFKRVFIIVLYIFILSNSISRTLQDLLSSFLRRESETNVVWSIQQSSNQGLALEERRQGGTTDPELEEVVVTRIQCTTTTKT